MKQSQKNCLNISIQCLRKTVSVKGRFFVMGKKAFSLYFAVKLVLNKRHKLFIFTVKIKRGEANEKKFTD